MKKLFLNFSEVNIGDISKVGGKNASLGEMLQKLTPQGVNIPDGFALTSDAYWLFINENNLTLKLQMAFNKLDTKSFENLHAIGEEVRSIVGQGILPEAIRITIEEEYKKLCEKYKEKTHVAVRSSATAEDLPDASFAGQHESFLNVSGIEELLKACQMCYISLFTDRAIKYRFDNGFDQMKVALSIGIQKMVRSDKGSSGVCFTLDPDSGFKDIVLVTGSWGLGENIVKGAVNPDEFYVFKPSLKNNKKSLIGKKMGSKTLTMIYNLKDGKNGTENIETPDEKRNQYVLSETEITQLAQWSILIEEHYARPMWIFRSKRPLLSA